MSAKSTASKSHTWTSRLQSPNLRCPAERLCSSLTVEIRWIGHDNQRRFLQLSSGHVRTHWPSNLFWQPAKHGKPWALAQGRGMFLSGTAPQLKTVQKKLLAEAFRYGLRRAYGLYVVDLIGFGEDDFDSGSIAILSKVKASVETVRTARPKWTSCGTTRPLADGKNERARRISGKSYDILWYALIMSQCPILFQVAGYSRYPDVKADLIHSRRLWVPGSDLTKAFLKQVGWDLVVLICWDVSMRKIDVQYLCHLSKEFIRLFVDLLQVLVFVHLRLNKFSPLPALASQLLWKRHRKNSKFSILTSAGIPKPRCSISWSWGFRRS